MILAYRHTGVNVTDMARAVDFYHRLLGLAIVERRTEHGPYIDSLTSLPDVTLDWVKVGVANGVLVELVKFWSQGHRREPERRDYATIGCNHLCFTVDDVAALYDTLIAAGVRCHPVQMDPPGRVKNFACYDPDGTIVELVEVIEPPRILTWHG